jgi:hypothetical protein
MTDIATHNDRIATIGMDLGKRSLHLIGMDAHGKVITRQQLSRGRFERHMTNLQPCLVGGRSLRRSTPHRSPTLGFWS